MENACPKCNVLNSFDAKFCTSCGASIKEPPEQDPLDLSTWAGRVKFAGALVILAASAIIGFGIFEDAISSWGWIWGIIGGIVILLLVILAKSV